MQKCLATTKPWIMGYRCTKCSTEWAKPNRPWCQATFLNQPKLGEIPEKELTTEELIEKLKYSPIRIIPKYNGDKVDIAWQENKYKLGY